MHSCGDPLHDFVTNLPLIIPFLATVSLALAPVRARLGQLLHRIRGHRGCCK